MTTTFAKLNTGDWGIRGKGLIEGAPATVTKRDGTSKSVTVGRIVSTGADGMVLATIAADASPMVVKVSPAIAGRGHRAKVTVGADGRKRFSCCNECGSTRNRGFYLCWDCKSMIDEDNGIYR